MKTIFLQLSVYAVLAIAISACSDVSPQTTCPDGLQLNARGTDCEPIECNGGQVEGNACVCPAERVLDGNTCRDPDDPCLGVQCNDGNECTVDVCIDEGCSFENATDGTGCEASGEAGLCVAGACEADACARIDCTDTNECTIDGTCNPATAMCEGAGVTADGVACDFGGAPGVCEAGGCVDAMLCAGKDCGDEDPCTEDTCNPLTGDCSNDALEEGASCEVEGVLGECLSQICVGLCEDSATRCNDGNACTIDDCDPATGCTHSNKNCSDGNSCTTDGCNTASGDCIHEDKPDGTICFIDLIRRGSCQDGRCVSIILPPPILL